VTWRCLGLALTPGSSRFVSAWQCACKAVLVLVKNIQVKNISGSLGVVQDVLLRGGKSFPLFERVVKANGPTTFVVSANPSQPPQVCAASLSYPLKPY
jgi:hypothetical protein